LQTVEAELAEFGEQLTDLRQRIASERQGPLDEGDIAALLTEVEEQEAIVETPERRLDALLKGIGQASPP
jgi:hypothetical protein